MTDQSHASHAAVGAANEALSLLKTGNAKAAADIADESLMRFPDHPALLQVAGIAALQLGNSARAAEALKRTLEIDPKQPGLWGIYGGALEMLGQYEEAVAAYDQAIQQTPEDVSGYRMRGMALSQLSRYEDALVAFGAAIRLSPRDVEAWLGKGGAHFALGDLSAAETAYENALAINPERVDAYVYLARVQVEQGRQETAVENFQHALHLAPQDGAIARQVATALWEMHLPDQAETLFKNGLKLTPDDALALATLATLYEQTNRLSEAEDFARQALSVDPTNVQAQKVQAVLERRKGDPAKALVEVERLAAQATNPVDAESLTFELARLNDKLNNTDVAYSHFETANRLQADSPAGRRVRPQEYMAQVQRESDLLTASPPVDQSSPPASDTPPDPVFLIGFPRSGTTLLDQVLDSHPDVAVMDERPPLADVHERLTHLENANGTPFVQLDEEQRRVARDFYFETAGRFVSDFKGKLLVDKNPLGTSKIRIIKLLFPNARIIFALRHPCDVVLSCFMQRFTLNIAMSNFHTLLGAVTTYEAVMGLWLKSGQGLGLPVHRVRYEDVVQDFETQIKRLLQFVDLPWDNRVIAFHEHAQTRHVRTASASQVTEPLYSTAVARWQRYDKYLAPHMNALRPFIESFGYEVGINRGN